jgi:hypothetical protein
LIPWSVHRTKDAPGERPSDGCPTSVLVGETPELSINPATVFRFFTRDAAAELALQATASEQRLRA